MTLPTSTRVTDPYETDGVQRDFEFDFPAFYNADTGHYGIEVRRLTALDYEVIDKSLYDIFLNDEDKSGYIRFHVAPMAGDDIYIAGDTTRSQQLNLINYGRYSAQSIEKAFDLIVALIQEFVSKVDEETRQRILADQALRDFLLIKFNQFTAEVTTKIDKHIGDINGFMSSLIPMFVCIMRKEIANYVETGMQDVIDAKLSDLSIQVANSLDVLDESVSRINAATTATAIAARLFDTPAAGVHPVTGVAVGSYFNVRSPNAESYVDEYQNVGGVPTPSGKSYPSGAALSEAVNDVAESIAQIATVVDQAVSDATAQAEGFAENAAGSAVVAGQKATEATTAVASTKQYVDSALSDLSTAANKFYPTRAEAEADIANISVNQPVTVGEIANGGLWYKATSGATTLTKSPYDPIQQGKNYTDLKLYNSSVDLFKSIGDSVQNSQMPVTRFTGAGVSNTYPDGTYQTVSGSGVGINVTRSGSTAIKHYFDTETFLPAFTAELEITGTIPELSSEGVGIGFKNGDVFEAIAYTATGNMLRTTDYSHELLTSGLGGFIVGDTVKFVFENDLMNVYVNDVKKGTAPIPAGSSIALGQMGFLSYIATIYASASDPIRDYVQEEISKIPSPDPTILPQAKQYTETFVADKSLDLFKQEVDIPYSSNMSVRRYTATSTSNDYPAGTYQTTVAGGVQLSVTAAGSNGIKHYFTTSIGPQYFEAEFKVTHQQFAGDAIGVGFKTGNNFEVIAFSNSGVFLRINNFTATQLQTGLGGYAVNDTVKFIYDGTKIEVFVNNAKIAEALIAAGDFITIGQSGFSRYLSNISGQAIDPIRDYVKAEIAEVANQGLSKGYYSFTKGTAPLLGSFKVYTQVKNDLYVGFEIKHEYDMREEIYQDYWRIVRADFYKIENGVMQPTGKTALGIGESEFVLKTNSTKVDFTGGYHGDELVTDIKFLADGILIPTTANIALTACEQFEYVEKSTMHETADANGVIAGHPKIADHIKHTVFKNSGYKTVNKCTWNYSGLMTIIYHGISCIHKDVATTVFSDDTYTDQAMTGSTNNYFNAVGARLYKGRNETNGLAVEAAAYQVVPSDKDALSEFFVHDRSTDSKYYRKTPAGNVAIGDKHESYFECKFLAIQ